MEVTIQYSKAQVEETVKYLARYNKCFLGESDYLRQCIRRSFHELVHKFYLLDDQTVVRNAGYIVIATVHAKEGIDHDLNLLDLRVFVDPSMMSAHDELIIETYDAAIPINTGSIPNRSGT